MWIQWLGTVLLLAAACHAGARLVVAGRGPGPTSRPSDAVHLLMCAGLIAMLVPLGDPIPSPGWEAVFGLVVGWSLVAALRERKRTERLLWARHAAAGIAMIYMFAAAPMSMSGMNAAAGWPGGLAWRAGGDGAHLDPGRLLRGLRVVVGPDSRGGGVPRRHAGGRRGRYRRGPPADECADAPGDVPVRSRNGGLHGRPPPGDALGAGCQCH